MRFRYFDHVVDCKVAYVSSFPHNLAVNIFNQYFLSPNHHAWHVHADRQEETLRVILEPKKLRALTPHFHLHTRFLSFLATPEGWAQTEVIELMAGAEVVVVVAREDEAMDLVQHARHALSSTRNPAQLMVQLVGPLSTSQHHALAAIVPVLRSPEEMFGAVMQAVADRFVSDAAIAAAGDVSPDPGSPASHNAQYYAQQLRTATEDFRQWPAIPFKGAEAPHPQHAGRAGEQETQVTPKVLLIILAVLFAIVAFGIIVGTSQP
jgi:hypothetical protein